LFLFRGQQQFDLCGAAADVETPDPAISLAFASLR
jgi:hypothetical protein